MSKVYPTSSVQDIFYISELSRYQGQKPIDTHPYFHWTSAYPPHLKQCIPYSQALRLRRICSSTNLLKQRIWEYSEDFVACGFKRNKVLTETNKALKLTQEEFATKPEKGTNSRMPLVTAYNLHTLFISGMANRKCHFLQSKERDTEMTITEEIKPHVMQIGRKRYSAHGIVFCLFRLFVRCVTCVLVLC